MFVILQKILDRFIYTEELPLETRMSNIAYLVGFFASTLLMVVYTLIGANLYVILVILTISISIIIMTFLANYFGWYRSCRRVLIGLLCFVLFPVAYFALGGLDSAMPAYFVLSIVILFLLSSGKIRNILVSLHIAMAISCYYLGTLPFFAPFVAKVENRYQDAILSFVTVGLCIGIIVAFQKQLYFTENERVNSARDDLMYRGRLLRMVNRVAELLLYAETESPEENFEEAMEVMVRCISADRMYIWRNQEINGTLHYVQEYEWIAVDKGNSLKDATGFAYINTIPPWEEKFSRGEIVNGPVKNLSETEQQILSPFGIKSILVIPIFLQKKFWGFVSFDNLSREKTYSNETTALLSSGCLLFANAAVRKNNEIILGARLKQQELMADISRSFISSESMTLLINEALRRMGEFMGVTRLLIAVADKENEESYPVYTWFASESWRPDPSQKGFNDTINSVFPKQMPDKGYVPTVFCSNTQTDEDGKYRIFYEKVHLLSFIWAPLYVNGSYWGLISVEECERRRIWNESDAQLVGTVSSAVAGAVTRDLMEKERAAALEQALQASLAKGNFLSNMSHEMRTPMNAIIGMTAIGKNAKDLEKKNYAFEKVEDASTHLLGVINDILDMSKIEANKLELSLSSFNFEKMLHKVVNVINFRVEERKQVFYVTIDKQIPGSLIGDDQRLSQVITNLLSNAVKFTPEEGTIRLNAQYQDEGEDDCIIRVEVIDSGIGITEEQQSRLFNSFVQAESSTTRKYGGTGLGLAISKQIVELMGGKILIESKLGKGASFIFTVRLKKDKNFHKQLLNPEVNWSNIRVLAVDDDVEICRYFSGIAEHLGIKCDIAYNAEEALELIEKSDYDIYFIDWKMPGMNGLELSSRIKARGAHSVITMISAAAVNEIEDAAKEAGVDKFLSKPIFPSDIADWINTCLGVPKMQDIPAETQEFFTGRRILLVEDVEINREIVLALLEPTGLSIDCAENGVEAVRMVEENPEKYEMIFMDVQMPEMDGYEATRRIRAFEASESCQGSNFSGNRDSSLEDSRGSRSIPIVAMTANVFREDIEQSLAAGMNDHVGKPLDFSEVLDKIRRYLPGQEVDLSRMMKYGESGTESEQWKYGLAWSPDLVTGNSQIDSQHKQIFRLTSSLAAACMDGRGKTMIGGTLDFLASYTVRHFADEEALQLQYNYPAYNEHKKQHEDFKDTVAGLINEYKQQGSSDALLEKVNSIIVRWLVEHIKQEDSKIAGHIRNFSLS
ncbi:hypothetical protein AGMMS50230_03160 [Spirochaetia bacterium]|nr:hypothetical protein AGMMS50230_03160 [Spirochaetia bacterium]